MVASSSSGISFLPERRSGRTSGCPRLASRFGRDRVQPMPSVRCPSCDTAQHVEGGVPGYTCSSCGRDWSFVVCRSCGSRFHAKPEATTWTCPKCGLLQEASSEPPPAPPPEPATPQPVLITDAVLDEPQ